MVVLYISKIIVFLRLKQSIEDKTAKIERIYS